MRLSTITNGQIQSGRLPDVTVVMDDNTVQPYEVLSPNQTARSVMSKYEGLHPIEGSQFRLAPAKVVSPEQVMELPEAAPIAEEAQAAIAAQEAEEKEFPPGNP